MFLSKEILIESGIILKDIENVTESKTNKTGLKYYEYSQNLIRS